MIFKLAALVCGVAVVALLTLTPASSQNASKKARVPEQQFLDAPAASTTRAMARWMTPPMRPIKANLMR